MWKWATVIGLSMTPNLFLGSSAACAFARGFGFDPWVYVPVVTIAAFAENLLFVWLAIAARRVGWLERKLARWHTPRAVAAANRWGTWGGLGLGPALVGQEPIIIALVWLDVPPRRLVLPIFLSNVVYTLIYYAVVMAGWDSIMAL